MAVMHLYSENSKTGKKFKSVFKNFFYSALTFSLSGCFAPINLNYDSARMMNKGSVEAQVNTSIYRRGGGSQGNLYYTGNNLGCKIGLGISNEYNLKIRTELIRSGSYISFGGLPQLIVKKPGSVTGYFEIDNKISIRKNILAVSIPVGLYVTSFPENKNHFLPFINFDPRIYYTFIRLKQFEWTLIPKVHCLIGNRFSFLPGLSTGFGFSKDLNKWAIRPELGYDGHLSAGIGFSYFFNNKTEN